MGRTVESYRMALEEEIRRWSGFERALRSSDREPFEEMMDACRAFASAGSNAVQPVLFEPMVMSILLFQEKRFLLQEEKQRRLETELDALKRRISPT
jgi:hypothetical protein